MLGRTSSIKNAHTDSGVLDCYLHTAVTNKLPTRQSLKHGDSLLVWN